MNPLKKSLFIALALFFGISSQPRKLKARLQRSQTTQIPQKIHKEITQVFTTDDQKKVAQEVKTVNEQAKTLEQKQNVEIALQQEVIKETAEIKSDLIEARKDQPQYINADQALAIIKSRKELTHMQRSSWTNSLIIKPFAKTYRLFLRVWNPKEYTALLEKERKTLEHALNVQAYNNLILLYLALDYETDRVKTHRRLENDFSMNIPKEDYKHMFTKDTFYKITTQAFEGGAIFAKDITFSEELRTMFHFLRRIVEQYLKHSEPSPDPAVIQSIWAMNQVIWEAQELREDLKIKPGLKNYDAADINALCRYAARKNNQKLIDNKKSYTQYLKDWILQPKNLEAVIVMAAIGGVFYLHGLAMPSWLKEYANSSIGSMKEKISKGYNATISSVKNLWNRVRENQENQELELPDAKQARMDAQEQALEAGEYFLEKGNRDATAIQHEKELADEQVLAYSGEQSAERLQNTRGCTR